MKKTISFIRLLRPVNCLMMGFAVIVGASLIDTVSFADFSLNLLLGFITAFTLTGASMAVNDYYDREVDMINEPSRPIPSGIIKPKESLIFAAVLTAIGLVAAFFTNLFCLMIAAASWVVSITYVTKGKRTGLPGNFLVSACVAIPLVYGSFVIRQDLALNTMVYASLAFLASTGREVTKGIVDIEGDKTKKIGTIAISYGTKNAAYMASAFFLSAVCLSFLPLWLGLVSNWFIPFVVVADVGFVSSSVMLMRKHSRENAKKIKNQVLVWMLMGLIAFIAGTIK
ncbi:MAG: geranylgeranylglycerol-phosphate geranylgeranyltransferase [Candidatus Bathyarchaeia archaeon]